MGVEDGIQKSINAIIESLPEDLRKFYDHLSKASIQLEPSLDLCWENIQRFLVSALNALGEEDFKRFYRHDLKGKINRLGAEA